MEHRAHAIGMSGLLVKSTVVMRENLEEMSRQGLDVPVMLGGAALTRRYVEEDCVRAYAGGRVAYARDAFDGLHLMDKIVTGNFDDYLAAVQARNEGRTTNRHASSAAPPMPGRCARSMSTRSGCAAPIDPRCAGAAAAVLGRARDHPTVAKSGGALLNERMLYQFQWGFERRASRWTISSAGPKRSCAR